MAGSLASALVAWEALEDWRGRRMLYQARQTPLLLLCGIAVPKPRLRSTA